MFLGNTAVHSNKGEEKNTDSVFLDSGDGNGETDGDSNNEDNYDNGKEKQEYKCTQCNKIFKFKCWFKRHMEIHTRQKCPCNFCPRMFNTKFQESQHQQQHASKKI